MNSESNNGQALSLLALRVSLGMLLVWWGLARVVNPKMGMGVQKKFYFGYFDSVDLQFVFGIAEVGVGLLVAFGLFRVFVVPIQLAITGFSAATIWSALLDPFALWLPVGKIAPVQHLFYPSVIALCAAVALIAFRRQDRFALDVVIQNKRRQSIPEPAE